MILVILVLRFSFVRSVLRNTHAQSLNPLSTKITDNYMSFSSFLSLISSRGGSTDYTDFTDFLFVFSPYNLQNLRLRLIPHNIGYLKYNTKTQKSKW